MNYSLFFYYVSEHQLPPVKDASHATPTTRDNQGLKLLKSINGDIFYVLCGSRTLGTTA